MPMCKIKRKCPMEELGGGQFPFCDHEGYGASLMGEILGRSVQTVRKNAIYYGGKKFDGKWYFPRCEAIRYLDKNQIDDSKWINWIQFDLMSQVETTARFWKESMGSHLASYLNLSLQDEIIRCYKGKILLIRNTHFNCLKAMNEGEL